MKEGQPNIKPDYYRPPVNPYIKHYGHALGAVALRPVVPPPIRKPQ